MTAKKAPSEGVPRKPEKPGQASRRMAALRKRRNAAGWHRLELYVTDAEEESIRAHLGRLRT